MSSLDNRLSKVSETLDRMHPSGLLYTTYEARLLDQLDRSRLPQHVAVLADGNRRWARLNAPGQPLVAGYEAGADRLREFCAWCDAVGIPIITLWVLSTDNLQRAETGELGPLLKVIESLVDSLAENPRWRGP
ncbi:putative di-trans,poly-cis-decaprenylcistransferase, partial [Cutibacterium avidum TM16]|uniref:undecaprenyl diphosphate synthase family protein n=1 Tax=Cutibacterium avidum TaxID=33010 RepID=UPI000390BCA1